MSSYISYHFNTLKTIFSGLLLSKTYLKKIKKNLTEMCGRRALTVQQEIDNL